MKKFKNSFIAVSLSSTMILQNAAFISHAENNNLENDINSVVSNKSLNNEDGILQVDPESLPHRNMGLGGKISPYILRPTLDLQVKTLSNPNAIGFGTVTTATLNARSGPSTSSEVIGQLSNGDSMEILEKDGSWYRILLDNKTAYVYSSYVKLSPVEKGIDVSKWNGTIDWNLVKKAGYDYVIIRAGYGTGTVDPYFKSYIQGAAKAGLKVGVYWFSYATSVAKAQQEADMCLKTIAPYKDSISYPVFFDYEYASYDYAANQGIKITKSLATQMAKTFLNAVENAGYINGIYTNQDFGDKYFDSDLLLDNNIWVAQYSSNCTYPRPYMMWQHTDKGTINGIGSSSSPRYFDLNYTYLKPTTGYKEEEKINLSKCSVSSIKDQTYTGKEIKPDVTVSLNGNDLILNEDYTVKYSNNINVGKATVTIEGIGKYDGKVTKNFNIVEIVPQSISNFAVSDKTTNSITLSWSKVDDIDGYEIYKYDNATSSYKLEETISDSSINKFTDSNLNTSTSYKYKIRSYKTIGDTNFYSKYSQELEAKTSDVSLSVIKTGYTTSDLNVRTGPYADYSLIGKLEINSPVEIVDVDNNTGWYKIKFEDSYGYVSNKFVELNTLNSIKEKFGTTTERLNVRTGPSTDYPAIGKVDPEVKIEIIGEDSKTGWYKIKFENDYGYVYNKYVTLEKSINKFEGIAQSDLNVRTGPSIDYSSIGILDANQKVDIVDVDSDTGWYKIKFENTYGFVSNKFITVDSPVVFSGSTTAVLNVRTGPSTDYDLIGKLDANQQVEVVGTDFKSGWYKIKFNGSYGYVTRAYVTIH